MERLVIVEDEDVTSQGMDTGGVHRCILGKVVTEEEIFLQTFLSSMSELATPTVMF